MHPHILFSPVVFWILLFAAFGIGYGVAMASQRLEPEPNEPAPRGFITLRESREAVQIAVILALAVGATVGVAIAAMIFGDAIHAVQ